MKLLKIGAAALNQTPLDWKGNLDNIVEAITEAKKQAVELLCLPELCITGYGCEDQFHSSEVLKRALSTLHQVLPYTDGIAVCVGLPMAVGNALYNVVAVIHDREVLGYVAKQHLAGDGLHYEPRWFKAWPANIVQVTTNQPTSHDVHFGDVQFLFGDVMVGFEICEDAWVAERPGSRLAAKGVDIILNPSASHFAFGKQEVRKRFVIEGSRAFNATYVYANLLGNEAGRAIYDGECLIATGGSLVAQGPRFSMKNFELTTAVVDVEKTRMQQRSAASFVPSHVQFAQNSLVHANFLHDADPSTVAVSQPLTEQKTPDSKYDEFTEAVPLALFDYMRKSRSRGFVVSLSGGADSAACAVLVHLMVRKGAQALGHAPFSMKLGIPLEGRNFRDLVRPLLTCLYQGTRNSSQTTLEAARAVAEGVGAKFADISVDDIVERYTEKISKVMGRELTWERDDLALQNIQARVRAPSVWMIANLENKLLLTTSNRSEAAVGYCTMDGDTAGSIAPIGGIDKAFLLEWLAYLDQKGIPSYPCLKAVLVQKPTAELRPGESQTDEEDLMPYPVLERIEDLAILEKKGPKDVYYSLQTEAAAPHLDMRHLLYGHVEKFFRLWCRNQWKRERYALSFHVDDKNLDPRSWCRFPVLSGGFETELEELRKELQL